MLIVTGELKLAHCLPTEVRALPRLARRCEEVVRLQEALEVARERKQRHKQRLQQQRHLC